MTRRAVTLLEILVVLVILGGMLAVTLGMVSTGRDDAQAAKTVLQTSLHRAHLLARVHGGATISGGETITIHTDRAIETPLPRGWALHLGEHGDAQLSFNLDGFAPDMPIRLEAASDSITMTYLGISGQLVEEVSP